MDEEELTREPDPDADLPYEDDDSLIRVHTYGRGWSVVPRDSVPGLNEIIQQSRAVAAAQGQLLGSGLSPQEKKEALEAEKERHRKNEEAIEEMYRRERDKPTFRTVPRPSEED